MSALLTRRHDKLPWEDPTYMAGTERTGKYTVVGYNGNGRVGFRELPADSTRIRIEPTAEGLAALQQHFTREAGWKQPGESGENRFSKVVHNAERDEVVARAVKALVVSSRRRSRRIMVVGMSLAATAAIIYWLSHKA